MSPDAARPLGARRRVNRPRQPTATSSFGVGRREAHDASDFYARFTPPELSADRTVRRQPVLDEVFHLDARAMDERTELIKPDSVALLVTSPPYFAGKAYENDLARDGVPADYLEYLRMLEEVFAVCVEKLEPGGRLAVNVANLGRKPYRSLSADVIGILQDRLGLLLRGEIIWRKSNASSGSCAWGSFQSAANPVLRDVTERVIVASKGRFDRALDRPTRAEGGLPATNTITRDDFLSATTDVWEIPPESATRVDHPAPFPVELPQRLIELYTYAGDVVLDPFMGSGSTAVAAVRTGRHYLGFDTDRAYVDAATARVDAERARLDDDRERDPDAPTGVAVPVGATPPTTAAEILRAGGRLTDLVAQLLREAGFVEVTDRFRLPHGLDPALRATDSRGRTWYVEVAGALTTPCVGLRRAEVVWRTLGRLTVLRDADPDARLIVATPELPSPRSTIGGAWVAGSADLVEATVDVTAPDAAEQLRAARDRA